jgi:hypothetical protein
MNKPLKYLLRTLLALLSIAAGVVGYGVWQMAFHVPDLDPTPLPAALIDARSSQGEALLASSTYKTDYPSLATHFEGQSLPAYCGVASSVIVLNALHDPNHASSAMHQSPITQKNFFTDETRRVMSPWDVAFGGMTLEQNGALLQAHGLDVTVTHAADSNLDSFRTVVQQNLATTGDYLLVNYSRQPLGEGGGGHFSPLGAYDAVSDEVLIMDVTDYNYPPTWVPMALMWSAMDTVDSRSGKTRGFVVVRAR